MESTLRKAEEDKEVAFIISHIPPGDTFFLSECSKRYKAISDRFSHLIRGHFFGHTHKDELKISKEYFNETKVTSIFYVAPSLTSFYAFNPSFRVFDVDSDTKLLKEYYQYGMNLTEANLNPLQNPKWKIRYRATEAFNLTSLIDLEGFKRYVAKIKVKFSINT